MGLYEIVGGSVVFGGTDFLETFVNSVRTYVDNDRKRLKGREGIRSCIIGYLSAHHYDIVLKKQIIVIDAEDPTSKKSVKEKYTLMEFVDYLCDSIE